ncbi:MAG: ABC transporter substrate-binding protein [Propionicimonas sp.]|uniref:ABC transporter substrate-binding protein n=1 Tax=Propionicimonas sp. TaxID=1955623 RepID=UPI002B20CB62|nr:ABC transporter substrate-binding protein [Propionicimonas sp.]MEA4945719.1 ABC transporter substrate-binding protein [Propionicimonas sp.]
MSHRRHLSVPLAAGLALLLPLAACSSTTPTPEPAQPSSSGASSPSGDPTCAAFEQYGDLTGKTVSVYAVFIDTEGQQYEQSFDLFEKCTGATVAYEGSRDFEAQLPVRVAADALPDIAIFPQPGLLKTTVASGKVKAAPASVESNVDQYWSDSWKAYGTVDGTFYAAPLGASAKSFVWYSPSMFADAGYTVPTTWDELITLTEKIANDGKAKPWCAGIESGTATGWPGTDWVEDMVLRFAGGETYDKWVSHEIPFNDPAIVNALQEMGKILRNDKYVNAGIGNVQSIATEPWTDAGYPIVDGECYLHRAASFYQTNWTTLDESIKVGPDGDVWVFPLPGKTADSKPVIGGGDFVAAFADRPEVQAFQTYLSSPEWANEKATATPQGWVSANNGLDASLLQSPMDQLAFQLLSDPGVEFRFDGSDLMPSEVGAGSFWKEITNYFAQGKSEQDVLGAIEASWPKK